MYLDLPRLPVWDESSRMPGLICISWVGDQISRIGLTLIGSLSSSSSTCFCDAFALAGLGAGAGMLSLLTKGFLDLVVFSVAEAFVGGVGSSSATARLAAVRVVLEGAKPLVAFVFGAVVFLVAIVDWKS